MYSETKVHAPDHIFEPSEVDQSAQTTDISSIKPLDQHIIEVSSSIADQDLELQELSSTMAQYDSQNEVTQFEMVLQECHLKTSKASEKDEVDTDAESDAFNQFYLSYLHNQHQQEEHQDEFDDHEPADPAEIEYSMDEFHDTFSDLLLRFYNCEDQASPEFVGNLTRSVQILSQWERLGGVNTKALLNYIIDQICNVIQSILKKLVTKAIMKYSLVDIDQVRSNTKANSNKNQNEEDQYTEDPDALAAIADKSIDDTDVASTFDDAQMSMTQSTIQASHQQEQDQQHEQQPSDLSKVTNQSQQYAINTTDHSRIIKYVTSENAEDFQMMVYTIWQYFELVMQTSNRLEDLWLNILESLNLEKPNKLTVFSMVHHQAYRNIVLKDDLIRQILTEVEDNRYFFCSTEQLIKMQNNQTTGEEEEDGKDYHAGEYLDKIYGIRRRANSVEESYAQFLQNYERSCHLKYLFMCVTQFDQKFQQYAMENMSTTNNININDEINQQQQQYDDETNLELPPPANFNNENSMMVIDQHQEEVSNNDMQESSLSKSDSDFSDQLWFADD